MLIQLENFAKGIGSEVVVVSAKVESELQEMDEESKKEFLEALGVKEAGLNRLIRAGFKLLGLQTYFTAGVKEVRAWTIRLFDTGVLFAYLDLQAPYSEQLQKLIDSIDSIEIVGYHPNNAKYIKNTTFNHKTNKVKIEVKDYTQNPALFTTTNLDIKTMSGTVESFYPSGKLSAVSTLKMVL